MGLLNKILGVAVCGRKPGKCILLIISFTIRRPWNDEAVEKTETSWQVFADLVQYNEKYVSLTSAWYICQTAGSWWRHQMETFSSLLAICAGNSPVPGEFPAQRPVTRSFDVFFDLRLNKPLSKQSWGWWFETLSSPLWRHSNDRSRFRVMQDGIHRVELFFDITVPSMHINRLACVRIISSGQWSGYIMDY